MLHKNKVIYLVISNNKTWPELLIKKRAELNFNNRQDGDNYAHIGISFDKSLKNMIAFTQKSLYNIFDAGLSIESLHDGRFAKKINKGEFAVIKLSLTNEQYIKFANKVQYYLSNKDDYRYNYLGLISMLLVAKGIKNKNRYFCSEWIAQLFKEIDLNIFGNQKPHNIKPYDFYNKLQDKIIYEGKTKQYPYRDIENEIVENTIICID